MVNRADALSNYGGDTTQMFETKQELEKLGQKADIALGPQKIDKYEDYDIIHLFNIQTAKFSYKEGIKVKKAKKPLVLSPIWFDFYDDFYDSLIEYSRKNRSFPYSLLSEMNTRRHRFMQKTKIKSIQLKLVNMADSLLPNSQIEAKELKKYFSIHENKILVVYNGVSADFLEEKDYPLPSELKDLKIESKNFALQVGGINSGKNVISSIKACKSLDIPLILIGNTNYKDYLSNCKKNASQKTYFLGSKKNKDIIPFYKHAKIHLLPSFRETPGLSSLEAGALGCNIVSTNVGSSKEYFGKEAFYCNPNDLKSIENAIKSAWNQPTSHLLKDKIRSNYTWKNAAYKTLKAYEKVTG